jgi:hypothetical protein
MLPLCQSFGPDAAARPYVLKRHSAALPRPCRCNFPRTSGRCILSIHSCKPLNRMILYCSVNASIGGRLARA